MGTDFTSRFAKVTQNMFGGTGFSATCSGVQTWLNGQPVGGPTVAGPPTAAPVAPTAPVVPATPPPTLKKEEDASFISKWWVVLLIVLGVVLCLGVVAFRVKFFKKAPKKKTTRALATPKQEAEVSYSRVPQPPEAPAFAAPPQDLRPVAPVQHVSYQPPAQHVQQYQPMPAPQQKVSYRPMPVQQVVQSVATPVPSYQSAARLPVYSPPEYAAVGTQYGAPQYGAPQYGAPQFAREPVGTTTGLSLQTVPAVGTWDPNEVFNMMDSNNDGIVSRAEFATAIAQAQASGAMLR